MEFMESIKTRSKKFNKKLVTLCACTNVRTTAGDPQIYISAQLFFFLKPRKFESMILSDII